MARHKSLIHRIEARERRGRWFPAVAGLLSIAILASSWVGLFAFTGANAAYGIFSDFEREYIPDVGSMILDFPDLSQVSRILASDGQPLAELHDGRVSEPVPLDEIPDRVVYAALAAEDKDFFSHEGVDFSAILQAAAQNVLFGTQRGGSTITQQVVKKTFVGDEITLRRKIAEAFVSAELERRYTKPAILEYYLNFVYFGSGAYGVKTAAREFFGKSLNELSIAESATLMVMVRNPSYYNPRRRPDQVLARRNAILREMYENGWISRVGFDSAIRTELGVIDHIPFQGKADHVVAEVRRQLLDLDRHEFDFMGTTKEARKQFIFGCPADDTSCEGGGGLKIYSTIDLEAQRIANEVLVEWVPFPDADTNLVLCKQLAGELRLDTPEQVQNYADAHSCAPTGAIATVDNNTGAVIAMASGLPFDSQQFDLAVQGRRNPGSAMKPFTLVAALNSGMGINLGTYYDARSPRVIDCGIPCSPQGNLWTVRGGKDALVTLATATSSSLNTVFAQVAAEIGPARIVEAAYAMGIQSELVPVLSLTLGTSEVSPLEMASAFSNFATNGIYAEPHLISRIEDRLGNVLYQHQISQRQVIDPAIFAAIRHPLIRVPSGAGTAPRANIGVSQAGKTGTHQGYRDAWYVGLVPHYTTAVWVGYEADQIPMEKITIHGEYFARVYGGSVPAPMWAEYMADFLRDKEVGRFPNDPKGTDQYFVTGTALIPSLIGMNEQEAIYAGRDAKFNVVVEGVPSTEPSGIVVGQNRQPGDQVPQGSELVIEVSTGRAPSGNLPNVVGMSQSQAEVALDVFEADSHVVITVNIQSAPAPTPDQVGAVLSMSPSAGTKIGSGTQVTLVIGA